MQLSTWRDKIKGDPNSSDGSGQVNGSHGLVAEMRAFEIHGGRFSNLLGLQVLATRGKWQSITHRVAHTMAAFKDNAEPPFYSEYLRILVAAGIAKGEEKAKSAEHPRFLLHSK